MNYKNFDHKFVTSISKTKSLCEKKIIRLIFAIYACISQKQLYSVCCFIDVDIYDQIN